MAELPFFFQQVLENSRLMDIETAGLDPTRFTPISAAMKRYGAEGDPTTTWFQFQTAEMTRAAPHRKYGRIRAAKPPMEPFAQQQWLKEWSLQRSEFLRGGGRLTKPSQYFTRMFEQLGADGGFLWVHNANFDISQFASEFATPGSVRNLYEGMAVPPFRDFSAGRSRIWPTQTRQAFQFRGIARKKPGSTFGAMRGWYGEYRTMIEQASMTGKPAVLDTMFISQAMMSMAQQEGAMRTTYDVFTGSRLEALYSAFGFGKYAAHGAGADVAAMEKLMQPLIETTEALYSGAPLRGRQAEALFRLGRMQPRLAEQNVTAMFAQAQKEIRETGKYRYTTRGGVQRYSKSYEDLLNIYTKRQAGFTYDLPVRDIWSRMGAAKGGELDAVLAAKRTIPALRPLEEIGARATYLKAEMMAALRGANPILKAGMAVAAGLTAYALLPGREESNTIEGLSHRGIAQDTRHLITDFGGPFQRFGQWIRKGVSTARKARRVRRFGEVVSPIFSAKETISLAEQSKSMSKRGFGKRLGVWVGRSVKEGFPHAGIKDTAFYGFTAEEAAGEKIFDLVGKGVKDPVSLAELGRGAAEQGRWQEAAGFGGRPIAEISVGEQTVKEQLGLLEKFKVKDVSREKVAHAITQETTEGYLEQRRAALVRESMSSKGTVKQAKAEAALKRFSEEEEAITGLVQRADPEAWLSQAFDEMGVSADDIYGVGGAPVSPGKAIGEAELLSRLGALEEGPGLIETGKRAARREAAQARVQFMKETGSTGWRPHREMIEAGEEALQDPEQLDHLTKMIFFHEAAEQKAARMYVNPAFQKETLGYARQAVRTNRTLKYGGPSQGLTHELAVTSEELFLRTAAGEESPAYRFWGGMRSTTQDPYYKGYGSFPAKGHEKTVFGRIDGLRHEGLGSWLRRIITDFGSGFLSKLIPMFSGARLSKLAQAAEGMAVKGWGKLLGVEVVPSMGQRFPAATREIAASGLARPLPGAFYHPSEEVLVGKHKLEQATGLITKEAVAPTEFLRPEMVHKAVVEERYVEKSLGKEMADIKELTSVKNISAEQLESSLQERWYNKVAKGAPEDVTARFYELKGGDRSMLKFFQELEGGEAHIVAASREARRDAALLRKELIQKSATPGRGWKQYRETFALHAKVAADPRQADILNKSIILHEAVERRAAQMYADPAFEGVLKEYLQGQKAIPIHQRSQGIGHELAIAHEERFLREAVGEQAPAYQLIGRIRQQMGDAYYKGFRFDSKTTLGEIKGFRDEGLGKGIRQILTEFGSGYKGLADMPGSKQRAATTAVGKIERIEQLSVSRPSRVRDEQQRIQRLTMNTMAEYAPDGVKRVRDFQSPHLSNNNGEGMPQRMFRMRRGAKRMYQP